MDSIELPVWIVALFGLITALGGLTGVAALVRSLSSAKKSRVEFLCQIIDAQGARITELERDLDEVKARYEEARRANQVLRSRIKLLAKIMTRIIDASDTASCVDDLVNGMQITRDERAFLINVVQEANHQWSRSQD